MNTDQFILGELRALRRGQDELSLAIRLESPWTGVRQQVTHALNLIQLVPPLARWALFLGASLLLWGAVYRNGKAVAVGVDLFFVALLFMGTVDV